MKNCENCGHTGDDVSSRHERFYDGTVKKTTTCDDRAACWFRYDLEHYGRQVALRLSPGKCLIREERLVINNGEITILPHSIAKEDLRKKIGLKG